MSTIIILGAGASHGCSWANDNMCPPLLWHMHVDLFNADIKNHLNKDVKVISKENRNRNDTFFGKVAETYDHIFVVSNGHIKKSFSYSDILSRDVSITFL